MDDAKKLQWNIAGALVADTAMFLWLCAIPRLIQQEILSREDVRESTKFLTAALGQDGAFDADVAEMLTSIRDRLNEAAAQ